MESDLLKEIAFLSSLKTMCHVSGENSLCRLRCRAKNALICMSKMSDNSYRIPFDLLYDFVGEDVLGNVVENSESDISIVDGETVRLNNSLNGLVEIFSLDHAASNFGYIFDESYSCDRNGAWSFLNASYGMGVFVYIYPGKQVNFSIDFIYRKSVALGHFSRVYFLVGHGSSVRVVEKSHQAPKGHWVSQYIEIRLERDSSLVFDRDCENINSFFSSFVSTYQCHGSSLNIRSRNYKTPWFWADYHCRLNGFESRLNLRSGGKLSGQMKNFVTSKIEHSGAKSYSNQLFKKVLVDFSQSLFIGCIEINNSASGSSSYQLNRDLMLSDNAMASSKPSLRIGVGDVKATHGSTSGPVDEDALFFLRSRGICPDDAMRILVTAFLGEI